MAITLTMEGRIMHLQDIQSLSLDELRNQWQMVWGIQPHARIGRTMLERSLLFKHHVIDSDVESRLQKLVKDYKRNPKCFDERIHLKPGVRLSRTWKGKKYDVLVKTDGFDYDGQHYSSLTQIANTITGTKWNGFVFFGLNSNKHRYSFKNVL